MGTDSSCSYVFDHLLDHRDLGKLPKGFAHESGHVYLALYQAPLAKLPRRMSCGVTRADELCGTALGQEESLRVVMETHVRCMYQWPRQVQLARLSEKDV